MALLRSSYPPLVTEATSATSLGGYALGGVMLVLILVSVGVVVAMLLVIYFVDALVLRPRTFARQNESWTPRGVQLRARARLPRT
jgi:hypothetical protein